MFTLADHMIIQYAAKQIGQYPTNKYIMLGDDIVITNDLLAEKYRELMQHIGVSISKQKSHVSKDTYEFAKR